MVLTVKIKKKLKNFILDVDFSTEAGCMGILGASGSGKSMTLKCIAGIETPDEGIIILDHKVLFDSEQGINLKPQERRVGYLFQNYALFPNMTVEDNIALGFKTRHTSAGNSETTAQVQKMIQRFHLEGLEQAYPRNLSGGEQQRAAVARMLLSEPEVLMFDEPFSALDTYLKEELQAELHRTMQEFGGISVLVTHSRDEVYKLSDTLLIMEAGQGMRHGDTKEMFRNPRELATARLTGCKNISPITVEAENIIKAVDWNVRLQVRNASISTYLYVGIRAHDFAIYENDENTRSGAERSEDVPAGEAAPMNVVRIQIREITEAPFEWNVMFTVAGETEETGRLWWKVSKELITTREEIEAVEMLRIRTEGILLLK